MSARGRICFHVPYLYPLAVGRSDFVGGIEVQDWFLARALAQRGFDVAVATCDFGQPPVEERDGVTFLRTYSTQAGLPGVRFFYPRLWKAMRALRRARADVYLANGAALSTGWAYDAARLAGAPFVFLAASDKDAFPSLPGLKRRSDQWWYLRALRGAAARVAQTEEQVDLFRDNFGLDADVIANPVDLPAEPVDAGANDMVLWFSTYKPSKRPDWFLDLARRVPDLRFVMIGFPPSPETNESWQAANRAAAELPNLEVHGFVDPAADFLRAAALLVHTSPLEGFPNILLESWSYGVPTVTAVDPGGVIESNGLGEVAGSVDALEQAVVGLMADPGRRTGLGARARDYVEQHHGPDATFEPLAALLDKVIAKAPRSRRP